MSLDNSVEIPHKTKSYSMKYRFAQGNEFDQAVIEAKGIICQPRFLRWRQLSILN